VLVDLIKHTIDSAPDVLRRRIMRNVEGKEHGLLAYQTSRGPGRSCACACEKHLNIAMHWNIYLYALAWHETWLAPIQDPTIRIIANVDLDLTLRRRHGITA